MTSSSDALPDSRGAVWTPDEVRRLVDWAKATRHPPYELLVEQFPGRTVQGLRLKVMRLRRQGLA